MRVIPEESSAVARVLRGHLLQFVINDGLWSDSDGLIGMWLKSGIWLGLKNIVRMFSVSIYAVMDRISGSRLYSSKENCW